MTIISEIPPSSFFFKIPTEMWGFLAGISIKTLQDYEGGRKDINGAAAGTVKKLSEALGCRMEDLID